MHRMCFDHNQHQRHYPLLSLPSPTGPSFTVPLLLCLCFCLLFYGETISLIRVTYREKTEGLFMAIYGWPLGGGKGLTVVSPYHGSENRTHVLEPEEMNRGPPGPMGWADPFSFAVTWYFHLSFSRNSPKTRIKLQIGFLGDIPRKQQWEDGKWHRKGRKQASASSSQLPPWEPVVSSLSRSGSQRAHQNLPTEAGRRPHPNHTWGALLLWSTNSSAL